MTRITALIAIAAIAATTFIAGGVVLISRDDSPSRTPEGGRAAPTEGGPELERHDAGELPAVERAARRFLASYLPLIYGKAGASIEELRSAAPRLRARLEAEPGRVPPGQAALTPHLERVTVVGEGPISALVTAHIKDSQAPAYPLVFHLQKDAGDWLVTRIGGP